MEQRRPPWDLVLVNGLELMVFLILWGAPGHPLLLPVGLVVVLALPGYLSTLLLFPRSSQLDVPARLVLSVAVTFGIVVSLSVVFLMLRLPFVPVWVMGSLTLSSLGLSIGAEFRRRRLPLAERFIPTLPRFRIPRLTLPERILVLAIVAMLIVSGYALVLVASRPPSGTYTTLFLLNGQGMAGNYPSNVTVENVSQLIIGVVSRENRSRNYMVMVGLFNGSGGGVTDVVYRTNLSYGVRRFWPGRAFVVNISLEPSQTWEEPMSFVIQTPGIFRLRLFLLTGQGVIYRENFLWINATA